MRPKTLALLAVAAMCGLVAMLGVQQVLSKQNEGNPETAQILFAKVEILPGQPLDETNVEFKEFPIGTIPEFAVTKKEQFQERSLKIRVFAGDLILETKLDKKGVRSAASQVPKGKCVAAVPIDSTMAALGLHPGDHVDVLVTYRSAAGNRDAGLGLEVKTVLENVEVFAIDGQMDATMIARVGDPKAVAMKAVQLLVTNEQNRLLTLAGDLTGGKLHLTLRGMNDDSEINPKDVFDPNQADQQVVKEEKEREVNRLVLPVEKIEPVSPAKTERKKWRIEIIAGDDRRVDEVDIPEEKPVTRERVHGT